MPLQHESDPATQHPLPEWGVDIKCGKGTAFSYGPWADRQREVIYKFFFPPDYQPMKVGKDKSISLIRIDLILSRSLPTFMG